MGITGGAMSLEGQGSDPRGPRPKGGAVPIKNAPVQVVGAVPLTDCAVVDCRPEQECCYINPVLAEAVAAGNTADQYKNDFSSFLVEFQAYNPNFPNQTSATFYLDKLINAVWVQQASLNNNTNGAFYPFNFFTSHPSYTGVLLYWNNILVNFGEGIYRVRLSWGQSGLSLQCMSSEPFCLLTYSCIRANRTVKFESWLSYKLGSITDETLLAYDLCGMTWYDSIRFKGKFGYEETEYEEKKIKYIDGTEKLTRSEALQNFTLKSGPLPKWLHDRFKVYFHLADELRVCDYNFTNSDWDIRRKGIIHNSSYKPDYKEQVRKSRVTCQYRERIQSVVKNICCDEIRII